MATETTITAAQTDSGLKAWKKTVYETPNQNNANATDIGWLRENDSRLNVVSELTKYDKQQVYKIRALTDGKFGIGSQSDKDIRVQVYDANNRVIADSKNDMGQASKNWDLIKHSNYDMKKGTYYVKVTRDSKVATDAVVHYALQMKQGSSYKNDYVTTQVALTQDQRAQQAVNLSSNIPAGLITYNKAATLMSEVSSGRSGLFGGVDLSGGGNIFGVKSNF
jgi:hypothetical protein